MKKCKHCQSEIDNGANICVYCGKSQKNYKLIIICALLTVTLLISTFCVAWYLMVKKENEEFYSRVKEFNQNYFDSCSMLEDVGNDIKNLWYEALLDGKNGINGESAIEHALENNAVYMNIINFNKERITSNYNKIKYQKCRSDYCEDIKNVVKDTYTCYLDFYELINSPTGYYKDYIDEFSEIDTNAMNYHNEIEDLLNLFNKK